MEFKNYKVIHNFISKEEKNDIIGFVDSINVSQLIENSHIKSVADELNGSSYMFDLTNTDISKILSNYQSSKNTQSIKLPQVFYKIANRIGNALAIPKDNIFLQILNQEGGGKIIPHYDSSLKGYINYKCNISVLSEDYDLYVEDTELSIREKDLYTFEASLFKHWTNEFTRRRILLSYGFILKYEDLGRNGLDPRVRLSERIIKYFQT